MYTRQLVVEEECCAHIPAFVPVGNSLRLVTHRLTIMVLEQLLWAPGGISTLQDNHVALVENVYEAAILQLRLFYKGPRDEIFLDMFEDEYHNEMVCWFFLCTFSLSGFLLCTEYGGTCAVPAAGRLHVAATYRHTSYWH